MNWHSMMLPARLRFISWWILALGLASALAIGIFVPAPDEDPLDDWTASKQYRHQLELYGGTLNVMQDDFVRWFAGLWHGKQLGSTVAFLSALTFVGLRFVAGRIAENAPALTAARAQSRSASGRLRLVDHRSSPTSGGSRTDRDASP